MIKKLKIPVREGLFLSNLTYKDIKKQKELIVKNQHFLGKFLKWVPCSLTQKAAEEKIKRDQIAFKKGDSCELGIFLNENLIGRVGFRAIKGDIAEIGYFLDEAYTKQGIMTDSVKALVDYGVKNLKLKTIIIKAHVDNISSIAIPKRLGFKLEGTQKVFRLCKSGVWVDSEVYSLSV